MAVKTVEKKNNTLGILGTLANIGGTAFGVPWLGALGTGMQGMNAMMNGDSSMGTATATSGAMNEILNGLKDIWKNPAKTDEQAIKDKVQDMTDTEIVQKWRDPNGHSPDYYGYGLFGPKGCVVLPPYYRDANNPWGWY